MGITDRLLKGSVQEKEPELPLPQPPANSWVKDLIDTRYQPKTERLKRVPIGFDFKRDPFDPSSYYNSLKELGNISQGANQVSQIEAQNRANAQARVDQDAALAGVSLNFTGTYEGAGTGVSRKYKLKGVSGNTGKAADFWGSKYGIKTVYGLGKGSVPGSDHPKGRALDFMITNVKNGKARGDALANDVIKNYKAWNVKYVIWNKYIWHPGRGWSKYSGPSDHTDHVHVSFNK